jgi:hypothetical protein
MSRYPTRHSLDFDDSAKTRRCRRFLRNAATAAAILMPGAALATTASTQFVCSLVGEGTHNGTNPTSTHQSNLQLYGTDLGFSFKHRNRVWMLFGDTWVHDDFICQAPPPTSDDSLGRINLWQDDDPDDCLDIRFTAKPNGEAKPIRVIKGLTQVPMGALRTPITGWSDNVHPYGYFIGEPEVHCQPHQRDICPDGLQCHEENGLCFDPGSSGGEALPTPQNFAAERLIAVSTLPFSPNRFRVGYTFATNKFLNATSRVIGRLNEHYPKNNIYEPSDHPHELLMWGRPNFLAVPPSSSDVYLLHHRLNILNGPGTSVNWQPRYFAGLDDEGDPTWTDDQVSAAPVIDDETVLQVQQFSVAWVAPINRFVMLYSGRFPRIPSVDQFGNKFGIFMRTAEHPWGPWSAPQLIWNADQENAYDCPYDSPGIMYHRDAAGMGCPVSDPYRPNWLATDDLKQCPATTPTPHDDFGVEYGVNILDTFTKPGLPINTATIYWNMSTWNPYRVVLMKTRLNSSVVVPP